MHVLDFWFMLYIHIPSTTWQYTLYILWCVNHPQGPQRCATRAAIEPLFLPRHCMRAPKMNDKQLPAAMLLISFRIYFWRLTISYPLAMEIPVKIAKISDSRTHLPFHDDIIKWKHFPRYWPFVWGIQWSPVISPHKGQWRWALMFSVICTYTNNSVNKRDASDLRRHHAHYDITVMQKLEIGTHQGKPLITWINFNPSMYK